MKRLLIKGLTLLMSVVFVASSLMACAPGKPENLLPEYTAKTDLEFFAYGVPYDGWITIDGEKVFTGEDYISVERYREYKEAGMTMLMLGGNSGYWPGTVYEGSTTQRAFKYAYEAGIEKIILHDYRLDVLIEKRDKLLGESGCMFQTQEEIVAYAKECLELYYQEPGFYGIVLRDEPRYYYAEAYGQVYRAAKEAARQLGIENMYIQMNLLPIGNGADWYAEVGTVSTYTEAYSKYVNSFLDETGADRVSIDIYAFRDQTIFPGFYANLQLFKQICMERNVKMTYCLQSFDLINGTTTVYRKVGQADMYSELATLLGMGVDQYAYYRYFQELSSSSEGTKCTSTSCFLDNYGNKNPVYYYGQSAMSWAQKFAPVITNYDYLGAHMYTNSPANFKNGPYLSGRADTITASALTFDNSYQFTHLKNFSMDNDVAFVTELKDSKNDLYMYMVQNVIDPANGVIGRTDMNVTVEFDSRYQYVAEFDCGEMRYVKLDNGVYKKTLSAGYAVYLVPLI